MVRPPILLHITQTAATVTTLDPAILATALALLAFAAIAIWLPRSAFSPGGLRHRRNRRRLARAAVSVLLFLALLPSVVPYDHLFTHDAHAETQQASVHVAHCHISPGTCSDAPITSGPGKLIMGDPLIIAPAMLAVLVATTTAVLVGVSLRPKIRPPLSLTV